LFCLNRRLWLAITIFVCLFICKSSSMMHCGNRRFLEVTWQMFGKQSKWKSNGGIIGSKAKSCCNKVQYHFLRIRWLWMNRKTIGEVIYIRVSDRKYNPIATQRGNVPTMSWRGKSAVFLMHNSLTSHGSSKKKSRLTAEESRTTIYQTYKNCEYHLEWFVQKYNPDMQIHVIGNVVFSTSK
jgi:hypothetical protein